MIEKNGDADNADYADDADVFLWVASQAWRSILSGAGVGAPAESKDAALSDGRSATFRPKRVHPKASMELTGQHHSVILLTIRV